MDATLEYPKVDLTELKLKRRNDFDKATISIYAQINRWLLDRGHNAYNLNSILMNKLVYYISKEVCKTNPTFVLNTGWYMYGPCYEEGRKYELEGALISIKPVSKEVGSEVEEVCKELFPLFRSHESEGTVMDEFLRYIYENKCDEPRFRRYYLAKHELICTLHKFAESRHDISQENPKVVHDHEYDFQDVLHSGEYSDLVGLSSEETNVISEFVSLVFEYLDLEMNQERQISLLLMRDIFGATGNIVLGGLSHLNYSKTFRSSIQKYQDDLQRDHDSRGHMTLKRIEEESRRISKSIFELTYRETR